MAKYSRQGLFKVNENKKLEIFIDEKIVGKDIVIARIESDTGILQRLIYSKVEHTMSVNEIIRKLKPKRFIKIVLVKKVGESNVEPEIN